jgi:hypothetical protein
VTTKHKIKKANTNVLAVDLSTLASDAEMVAGDPFFCGGCAAVFSSHSTVNANNTWVCEFCNHPNNVAHLEEEEKPKIETVEFLLEPASSKTGEGAGSPMVIFTVDISGSMCSSTEVPGSFKLKGTKSKFDLEAGDDRHQHFPGANRNVTYVSRLQCVQAAIESQLEMMANQMPDARVALVTFNRDVTIYGDCISGSPVVVSGDKLNSYEQLVAIGEQNKNLKPIGESKAKLIEALMKLEEDGPTALGPAVAVSLGMARGSLGSRIVLATDGLSNTGIGSMDVELLLHEAQEYYDKLAVVALGQSTTINIVGIRGGDSVRMGMLGKLSDVTQGEVSLVDPLNIVSEFASMLQAKIVATNVVVKLLLHTGLALVNVDASKLIPGVLPQNAAAPEGAGSNTQQTVGNAYEDSELTFEYEVKNASKLDEIFQKRAEILGVPSLDASAKQLPFQVQITYTKLDGAKCIRTITRTQQMTSDREQAERTVKAGLLGAHAWAQSARLAEQGHYEAAMVNNMQMNAVFARSPVAAKQSAQYSEGTSHFNDQLRSGLSKRSRAAPQQQQQQQPAYGAAPQQAYGAAPQAAFLSAPPAPYQPQQAQQAFNDDDETTTSILKYKVSRKKKTLDRD